MSITKKSIIDTKSIRRKYAIHHVTSQSEDVYFCKCGKKLTKEDWKKEEESENGQEEFTVKVKDNKGYYDDLDIIDDISGTSIICSKCNTDYSKSSNFQIIKPSNEYFYGSFSFEEIDGRIKLYKSKVKASCTDKSKFPTYKEVHSYISVSKEDKKIFFKSYKEKKEKEYNLDSILDIVNSFYGKEDLNVIDNLIAVHRFLNSLAGIVVDSKNMDIVDGLMSKMIGRPGMDILMKITTIFLGVICYSNLSTIALTKGTVFLYDMMSSCNLPNVKTLSDNGVTSPVKIFNFLVSLENEEVQDEIESESKSKEGYVYESKDGKKLNINLDLERFGFTNNKKQGKLKIGEGKVQVRENLKNKKVSKYIFNSINKFDDYKKLIRLTKFITYDQLIVLVMKYDIDYLVNLFDIIEFRDDVDMDTLQQIIPLTMDFLKKRAMNSNFKPIPNSFIDNLKGEKLKEDFNKEKNKEELAEEDLKLNYSFLQQFSFYEYDDCVRMIEELKWDRSKDFSRIKTMEGLKEYHDKLVEHYNMLSDKEKYDKFKQFAKKFSYLEDYKDTLKVKVLSTPKMVLDAAKDMKNCAGSYVTRISQGKYILMLVWDKSKRRKPEEEELFMMGLTINVNGLEFEQLKATCNKPASDRQRKLVMTYLKNKDISFQEVRDLRISRKKVKKSNKDQFNALFGNY